MIFGDLSTLLNIPAWLVGIIIVWSLIWKGLALWKAAGRKSPMWFIAILIINTVGILEILYIYLFSEIKLDGKKASSKKKIKKRSKK